MSFGEAIKTVLTQKYATFSGRARRSEYWWFHLFTFLIGLVLMVILVGLAIAGLADGTETAGTTSADGVVTHTSLTGGSMALLVISAVVAVIFLIASLGMVLPSWSLTVRRLHDIGFSGWWLLIGFVPMVGAIALFVFSVLDSQPGDNQYGPSPKGGPSWNLNPDPNLSSPNWG